jgi:creatinine amidohydrolase
MLHLQPQLVDMSCAENFSPVTVEVERESQLLGRGAAYFGWQAQDLHLSGASGNAAKATAELGKELVERAAKGLVKLVEEISHYPLSRLRTRTAFDGA